MNAVTTRAPTLEETVARMKREILIDRNQRSTHNQDVAPGRLRDAKCFGDLHDYADANEYGGFCDNDVSDALIAHFGGRDKDGGWPDDMIAFINAAQEAVDQWIRSGEFLAQAKVLGPKR